MIYFMDERVDELHQAGTGAGHLQPHGPRSFTETTLRNMAIMRIYICL